MIETLKSPFDNSKNEATKNSAIVKQVSDLFPEGKSSTGYYSFIETLDRILGKSRFDILSSQTFTVNSREQEAQKKSVPLFKYGSAGLIVLGFILVPVRLTYSMFSFIGAAAFLIYARRLKQRPSTEQYNKLMEGAIDPEIARIILDWAYELSSSTVPFFQRVGDKITGIHPDQREAANRVMGLLGDDRHRQALGVNKFIPNTPYLYRMSDRHKIFQPLIQALSKTTQYGHFNIEPESKTEPDPDTKSNTIPVIVASKKNPIAQPPNRQGSKLSYALKSKKEINAARIASAKRRGTYYKKPTRKTHDYKHLQIILDRKDMMKLVTEYSKTEDCQFVLSKSKTARERWMKAFKYIYDNWAEWEAYRENPNLYDTFAQKLFNSEHLNIKLKGRKKFRLGEHREISGFVIDCYIIPVSELSKGKQMELLLDSNL